MAKKSLFDESRYFLTLKTFFEIRNFNVLLTSGEYSSPPAAVFLIAFSILRYY